MFVAIFFQYPRQRKSDPNHSQFVTLQVYQVHPDTGEPDTLLSSFANVVRHTKWQKLMLPTTALQRLIDNPDKDASRTLHLRIDCAQCKRDVLWPVMLFKKGGSSSSSKRHNKRASTKPKNKRRVSKRSQRRRKKRRNEEKENKRRPHIVVIAKSRDEDEDNIRSRGKRHSGDCENGLGTCCKKTLYISFKELGWDNWILQPEGFFANYCEGNCPNVLLPHEHSQRHSQILHHFKHNSNKLDSYKFCCSPKKMRPLSLIYLTEDGNIIKTNLANMIVDKCGCA